MKVTVPVVVTRLSAGAKRLHTASTVSGPRHVASHVNLASALEKLSQLLLGSFRSLAREGKDAEIAATVALPPLSYERLDVHLDLSDRTLRGRPLFLTLEVLGRRVAFTPSVPDAWFTLERGADLAGRATEVLTEHLRRRLRDEGEELVPKSLGDGTSWLTHLELELPRPRRRKAVQEERERARLGPEGGMDGEEELARVGRRLEGLGLEGLGRALFREHEVGVLGRYVAERRPILLVGERGCGKTAILHEHVRRKVASAYPQGMHAREGLKAGAGGARGARRGLSGSTWLLSPGRLISGMSYVGQWEDRLLAILRAAERSGHTLFFDDLVGLFFAGRSSQSSLSVAHVLAPWLEGRRVAVAGEITPAALRVLRERDRGFADRFHLVPVREPSEEETLRVLLHLSRALEEEHGCRLLPEALVEALALSRRWVRDRALPGKVVPLLSGAARRSAGSKEPVGGEIVRGELERTSGLTSALAGGTLDMESIARHLGERIVGQASAVRSAAEVAGVAAAQLADPARPLGSLLFLGPTGVGKTQLAKELAGILFRDESQLVRFDMNELGTPGSAARLVGTPDQPEGLLTSALRRQPWCVLLLDEVEKADPAVLDLLLQVLEDGRLTDALGRTADFTTALVILTSNLGAREAASGLGFAGDEAGSGRSREGVFRKAAERFFRPELLNRFDRIVVFDPLRPEELTRIARRVLSEAAAREGFRRRHACLDLHPLALARVAEEGYHPQLGARALKRAVERGIVQPVAARLAALPAQVATVVRVNAGGGAGEFDVDVQELAEAEPITPLLSRVDVTDPAALLDRLDRFLLRHRERLLTERLVAEPLDLSDPDALTPDTRYRLHLRELLDSLAAAVESAREESQALRVGVDGSALRSLRREESRLRSPDGWEPPRRGVFRQLLEARDARETLAEMARAGRRPPSQAAAPLERLVLEAAYVEAVSGLPASSLDERALLLQRAPGEGWPLPDGFLTGGFRAASRLKVRELGPFAAAPEAPSPGPPGMTIAVAEAGGAFRAAVLEGPLARMLAELEAGTHLFWGADGSSTPMQVWALTLESGESPEVRARAALSSDVPAPPYGPVVRVGTGEGDGVALLDARTGVSALVRLPAEGGPRRLRRPRRTCGGS